LGAVLSRALGIPAVKCRSYQQIQDLEGDTKMPKVIYPSSYRRGGLYAKRARTAVTIGSIFLLSFLSLALGIHSFSQGEQLGSFPDSLQLAVKWLYADGDFSLEAQPLGLVAANLLAPFLLPILGVFAFVDSLRLRLWFGVRGYLPFVRSKPLVVVIGLGDKGLEIVKSARRDGNEVVVIEQNPDSPLLREAGALGATAWIGDGSSRTDLAIACWCRPRRLWIMTNDNDVNLQILDQVNGLFAGTKAATGSVQRMDVYLSIDEAMDIPDVITLASLNIASKQYYVHLTHMEEDAAMWLLRCFPMALREDRAPRALVIGLGEQGRAILKELYMLCHYPEITAGPEFVAVERDASSIAALQKELAFLHDPAHSKIAQIPIVNVLPAQDARAWTFDTYRDDVRGEEAFTHVFISIGSDVANIALAERIWAWEKALAPASVPTIVPIIYQRDTAGWVRLNALNEKEPYALLHPFCVDDAYSSEALAWRVGLEAMAKRVNDAYGGDEDWFQLSQEKRRSNLANARALLTRFPRSEMVTHEQGLLSDEGYIEKDAECEHNRWNAYVLLAGIHLAELPNGNVKYKNVKLRDLARVNANLVPYEKLEDSIKEYDRKMVRQRHEILAAFKVGLSND
jgi:hypothetical protein